MDCYSDQCPQDMKCENVFLDLCLGYWFQEG
jgi:hypothetical protein